MDVFQLASSRNFRVQIYVTTNQINSLADNFSTYFCFMASTQILNASKSARIIHRMAYEIWEKNYSAKRIILLGIAPKGPSLAQLLLKELDIIQCPVATECHVITIDKKNPSKDSFELSKSLAPQAGDVVIIVDDVLYTGRTLTTCIMPFVEQGFEKVQVAVLVFRDFLRYPIRPDFVGMALASTTLEHVDVHIAENEVQAFLN